ncbi:MAG: tRNA (adenosine(37)-N6)-threonylcarbamoyltransferase complex transferase subunit TsaD [Candidatus Micrarchaeia archaeon]
MLVIGIESSAHTFGVGIVDGERIIANEKSSYNVGTWGMIPSKVAEFHISNARATLERAVERAGIDLEEIEGVGYTMGPGIGPCLQVGELTAKTIAAKLNIDIVPVHHGIAHIEIAKKFAKLKAPIALYVSGGNSQILKLVEKPTKHYAVLGETFDIGVGNMLDNFARSLKLNPAWGSSVAKLAEGGKYIPLPYTVKGTDFAFTGLLTSAVEKIGKADPKDIAFSLQETAFSMLCEATERSLLLTNSRELCVCGGVAQSKRLKEMLSDVAKENGARFGYAPDEFNADNGAMIAYAAEKLIEKGISVPVKKCGIEQKYRIDRGLVW